MSRKEFAAVAVQQNPVSIGSKSVAMRADGEWALAEPSRGCRALGDLAGSQEVIQNAIMKVRDILRLLTDNGWVLVRTRGSHQQFKHPSKPGLVTLAGSGNDDLAPGTLNSILKQAGLKDRGQE